MIDTNEKHLMSRQFYQHHDKIITEYGDLTYSLVRISSIDVDTERFMKLEIQTENNGGTQGCSYDITGDDSLWNFINWFGVRRLSKIKGMVVYKVTHSNTGGVMDQMIVGFMKTDIMSYEENDPAVYMIKDLSKD